MDAVRGKDVIIYFNIDGTYEEFGCAETMNIEKVAEIIETSTAGTGVDKTWDYQSKEYSIGLSGLVLNDDPKLTVWGLWAVQDNFLTAPYRMVFTDPSGTLKAVVGIVLIRSINLDGSQEDLASSTLQFQGSGPTLILDSLTPVQLTMQVVTSPGTVTMGNIRIKDELGIETVVFAGTITNGTSQVVDIIPGSYQIRATLNSDRPFNLFYSDALPGFAEHLDGAQTNVVYWPEANSSIWDFTASRFLKWQGSNTIIS